MSAASYIAIFEGHSLRCMQSDYLFIKSQNLFLLAVGLISWLFYCGKIWIYFYCIILFFNCDVSLLLFFSFCNFLDVLNYKTCFLLLIWMLSISWLFFLSKLYSAKEYFQITKAVQYYFNNSIIQYKHMVVNSILRCPRFTTPGIYILGSPLFLIMNRTCDYERLIFPVIIIHYIYKKKSDNTLWGIHKSRTWEKALQDLRVNSGPMQQENRIFSSKTTSI